MRLLPGGRRGKTPRVLLLCVLTLALFGCQGSAALISGQSGAGISPAPRTPGALVTDSWAYEHEGSLVTVGGEWVHLPAVEAGELLLWVEHAEGACP